ncbi:MAG: ATP-binding protein [Gammaproteobacteria bacterium]
MNSLKARLLLTATLVLLIFIVFTGLALDRAFHSSAEQAVRDRLQGLVYALLGAAEIDSDGAVAVAEGELPDERLQQPDSGLYQVVMDNDSRLLWRSPSLLGKLPLAAVPGVGEWSFQRVGATSGPELFTLAFGVNWTVSDAHHYRLTFAVAEDVLAFKRQLQGFRRTLFGWLIASAAVLLLVQLFVLAWGMAPIRQFVTELRGIEAGDKGQIETHYPAELRPLANGLNALLRHERNQQTRYRNALADLAHSLKTPLAVIRALAEQNPLTAEERLRLSEQVGQMDRIVAYQLHKASTAGRRALMQPIAIRPICERIVGALTKVYQEKDVKFIIEIDPELAFPADEGDLTELFGNLLDNACKFCKHEIEVGAQRHDGHLHVRVEDDGRGFPPGETERVLKRGERGDTRPEGQGIGLSAVQEIVAAYDGEIMLERSARGGGRVALTLAG